VTSSESRSSAGSPGTVPTGISAVLFDRDGTLVHDVPGNRDPALLVPMPTAADAVRLARRSGLRTGVATNQPGIGLGTLSAEELHRLHARVDELLGPLDVWEVCPHAADAGCDCRKPQPGLLLAAAARLCLRAEDCVFIGDIATDVEAARRAGMASVLVPNSETSPADVAAAPLVAETLLDAVRVVLAPTPEESRS
jgi:D-glycero-D-manno-heptose 1,7-bisphosphate phosphatase